MKMNKNDNHNVLLVIGNGFDLSCGLKSKYSDFFHQRFIDLFGKDVNHDQERQVLNSESGIDAWSHWRIDYFMEHKSMWPKGITRWDCIFLFAEELLDNTESTQWQNIENIIFNVISIALWPKETDKSFRSNLRFSNKENGDLKSRIKFDQMVNSFAGSETDSLEQKANNLLIGLNDFEKVFAKYITDECTKKDKYKGQAAELLKVLANWYSDKNNRLDVISFNYSLDARFGEQLKGDGYSLGSWTNIHGIANYQNKNAENYINRIQKTIEQLPAPIFGVDNHDILQDGFDDDLRLLFTKSYRLVNSKVVSMISDDICSQADTIIFYGHSLGRADYSYFETLFDDSNLYHSKTKLKFYYYEGNNALKSRQRYTSDVVKLLTNYGQTLSNIHGENIVNKLVLEHRLEVLPYPRF